MHTTQFRSFRNPFRWQSNSTSSSILKSRVHACCEPLCKFDGRFWFCAIWWNGSGTCTHVEQLSTIQRKLASLTTGNCGGGVRVAPSMHGIRRLYTKHGLHQAKPRYAQDNSNRRATFRRLYMYIARMPGQKLNPQADSRQCGVEQTLEKRTVLIPSSCMQVSRSRVRK